MADPGPGRAGQGQEPEKERERAALAMVGGVRPEVHPAVAGALAAAAARDGRFAADVVAAMARLAAGAWAVAGPGRAAGPLRTFRLTSGFAEHDEKFGSSATVDVPLAVAPDRYEAERLIAPAIRAATVESLGEGDWRPAMNWLDVIELLEPLEETSQGD